MTREELAGWALAWAFALSFCVTMAAILWLCAVAAAERLRAALSRWLWPEERSPRRGVTQ